MKVVKVTLKILVGLIFIGFFLFAYGLFFVFYRYRKTQKDKPRLFFGSTPLINNKYWSNALKEQGYFSETIMREVYSINSRGDFDWIFSDFKLFHIAALDKLIQPYLVLTYVLRNFDIVHLAFDGGVLYSTPLEKVEAYLYKMMGIKIVVLSYGADYQRYSQTADLCWRHALITNYPFYGRDEVKIVKRVDYYNYHADCILLGQMVDGAARWDILPVNFLTIDEIKWKNKEIYSKFDGKNGSVKVVHTPNHRGVKGTEFIIQAVAELKEEGFLVELVLLEKIPNEQVREVLRSADILVEQLIFPGYALSAIEGMASGLPVISNLLSGIYKPLFTRYSYLSECPIVPSDVENIKLTLKSLITQPHLREELGKRGRAYIEKYNSKLTAQLMFGKIYEKIWYDKKIDLINYFHPIIGQYSHDYHAAHSKIQSVKSEILWKNALSPVLQD